MNRFTTLLMTGMLLLLSTLAIAQGPTFSITPQSQSITAGSPVTFTISVSNFNAIEGLQFSMAWDPAKLTYSSVSDMTLQGLNAGAFALSGNSKLGMSWFTPTGGPIVAPNGSVFKVNFTAVTTGTAELGFSNVPTPAEIIGTNGSDITNSSAFVPAVGTTNPGGGGGGNTCSVPSGISSTPANTSANVSWAAVTGATNYTIQYKQAAASNWISATSGTPSFTIPGLTVCTDYQVQVQATCPSGTSASSSASSFKTTGCTTGGGPGTGAPCWVCSTSNISGFGLLFSDAYVDATGDDAELILHTSGFTKIEGMQFEIKWDASKLQYKSFIPVLDGLTAGSLNLTNAANGTIGLTWTTPSGTGMNLSDCSEIIKLKFKVLGGLNSTAALSINPSTTVGNPTLEITANNGANLTVAAGNLVAGNVYVKKCSGVVPTSCTTATYDKTLNISQATAQSLDQVCVDVIVNNFTKIDGLQFGISWDANRLTFLAVQSTGLTDLNAGQYNVGTGTMTLAYNSANAAGITLANGASAFRICFTVAGNNGTTADVKFDPSLLGLEVTSNSTVVSGVTTQNGKVVIAAKPVAIVKEVNGSCGGTATGKMTAELVPATGNYEYAWTGPNAYVGTGQTISNLKNGTYRVTVTDKNTCLKAEAFNILNNRSVPKVTKLEQKGDCIDLEVTGGFTFTYKWDPTGAVTQDLCNIASGVYKVTITNEFGCTKDTAAAFLKVAPPTVVPAKCGKDGKITFTDATLNYTWSASAAPATGMTANNLAKGIYTVTISTTGTPKAATIQDITVDGPAPLAGTAKVAPLLPPNGAIDFSPTGGTGTLTYLWNDSNKSTTQDITALPLGSYSVTTTDQNGCTMVSGPYEINCASSPLVFSGNETKIKHTTCGLDNGSITVVAKGGSGDYLVKWTGVTSTTTTIDNLKAGIYNVTVADKHCGSSIKVDGNEVKTSDAPQIQLDKAVDAKDNCAGSITLKLLNAGANPVFTWTGPTAIASSVQNPTNLCEGIYAVTMTDAIPCVASLKDITITGAPALAIDDTKVTITKTKCGSSCDGKIVQEGKGGKAPYTYTWSFNGQSYPATSKDLSNLCKGVYTLTLTDASAKTVVKTFDVKSESNLDYTVKVTDPVPSNAKNGAIIAQIIDGVAPYTYKWSNGTTSNQINNLVAGLYGVTVTDANGCTLAKDGTKVGDVGIVEIGLLTNFNGGNIRCFGMCNAIAEVKSVASAKAPLTYRWSNGDTSRVAKGLCVGVTKVIVTDANKTTFEGTVTITGPDKLDLDIKTIDAVKGVDGTAEVKVKGGTAPFLYRWNNDVAAASITNQTKGRVFVMVTDANGCEAFKDGFIGPIGADVPCLTAIPVITPNEDGYNDYLDIYCLELYPQNKLEVFNRYGQVVFEQSNYVNRSWSPRDASGNPLPDGGYFYVIQVFEVVGTPGKVKGSFNIVSQK